MWQNWNLRHSQIRPLQFHFLNNKPADIFFAENGKKNKLEKFFLIIFHYVLSIFFIDYIHLVHYRCLQKVTYKIYMHVYFFKWKRRVQDFSKFYLNFSLLQCIRMTADSKKKKSIENVYFNFYSSHLQLIFGRSARYSRKKMCSGLR
jgi:hypothetical protein